MSVLPLGANMACKWDAMGSPPMGPYKMDRPAYSTPPPVENIPSNNECKMVELRGSKVASFNLGCDEYICLPQAFDLFLKHLVGGLHTVYTKLKRLSITPVVCNVEQVRILRGLGAIQPGVNRCKLITRKDFEILYQDCTTASRPGRPPKRYPVLPPTTDLMSHHASLRSNNTLLNQTDLAAYQKRMRLDQNHDRRASGSPTKENDKSHPTLPNDLHNNPTANLAYFQQALRQQYQHAAVSGLHNGLDPQQINPALAPLMMMSHPALFPSGIPPTSMAMLNHINQIAQSHAASGAMTSAAAAVAQLAANGGKLNPHGDQISNQSDCRSPNNDKEPENEENQTARDYNSMGLTNGIGSDGRTSPTSSLGSMNDGVGSHAEENNRHSDGYHQSLKDSSASKLTSNDLSAAVRELTKSSNTAPSSDDEMKPIVSTGSNTSSMQTLLTNIQGLLKVAADNASLQEKYSSNEIAELKFKLNHEKQRREIAEQKLNDCEKERAETEIRLHQERSENKKLQTRLISMQQLIGHDVNNNSSGSAGDVDVTSRQLSPPLNRLSPSDACSDVSSPGAGISSPVTSSFENNLAAPRIAGSSASQQSSGTNKSSSPCSSPNRFTPPSSESNVNNNNNFSDDQKSPDFRKQLGVRESGVPEIALDLVGRSRSEHAALQGENYSMSPKPVFQAHHDISVILTRPQVKFYDPIITVISLASAAPLFQKFAFVSTGCVSINSFDVATEPFCDSKMFVETKNRSRGK